VADIRGVIGRHPFPWDFHHHYTLLQYKIMGGLKFITCVDLKFAPLLKTREILYPPLTPLEFFLRGNVKARVYYEYREW